MKHLFQILIITGATLISAQEGRFPVIFENNSNYFSDDEIYIFGVGMNSSNQWCHYTAEGDLVPLNTDDINAPGHLTKNGQNYADYAFTVAEADGFMMNTSVGGGRLYISLSSPVYIAIFNNGWAAPNPDSPSDPNIDVIWDLYEFTYKYNELAYGGNISRVDQFGLPMTVRLKQDGTGYDEIVGTTMSREEIFAAYDTSVAQPFRELANDYRIIAPRSSSLFAAGGAYENYLQPYIDETWEYYSENQFELTRLGQTFTGQVTGDQFNFSGQASGTLNKPSTIDVFACAGTLASAGMSGDELLMGAEFAAAFNRGVAMNTFVWWGTHSDYYSNDLQNDYSEFLHDISIDNRAYALAYDDINDQSSVKILGNSNPLTSLTITVQPFGEPVSIVSPAEGKPEIPQYSQYKIKTVPGRKILLSKADNIRQLYLFSVNGRNVMTQTYPQSTIINAQSLPSGVYFLRVERKSGAVSKNRIVLF